VALLGEAQGIAGPAGLVGEGHHVEVPAQDQPVGLRRPPPRDQGRLAGAPRLEHLPGDAEPDLLELLRQQIHRRLVAAGADGIERHEPRQQLMEVGIHRAILARSAKGRIPLGDLARTGPWNRMFCSLGSKLTTRLPSRSLFPSVRALLHRARKDETCPGRVNHAAGGVSMSQKVVTGAEKLIQALEREGVEYIFGLSGGAAMPLFDALVDSKIQLVLVRHGQGGTHMADGFARATGRPGVVLVTSGPGATNTVSGLLTAHMDSAPVVVICGQTLTANLGKDAFQEADVTGITYPVVKHSYLIKDPRDIPRVVKEAFYIATTGRPGPVLIDVPKDVSSAPCSAPFVELKDLELPGYRVPGRGDAELIGRAAELLRAAKRPMLYVGHGAVISGAGKAVMKLAERLRAPVVNTLLGKGAADETHSLHLGMLGM